MTTEGLFQVEIQICVGRAKPIPVPDGLLPAYTFGRVGPAESKTDAEKRQIELCKLNPGYHFCVSAVRVGA